MFHIAIESSDAIVNSDIFAFLVIKDRQIIWGNKAVHALFGYGDGELVGQSTRLLHFDEDAYLSWGSRIYPEIAKGRTVSGEMQCRRKDGEPCQIAYYVSQLHGHPGTMVATVVNITEQRQLREKLQLQADILASITDGVSVATPDGKIIYTNRAFNEMFGYADGELEEKRVSDLNASTQTRTAESFAAEVLEHLQKKGSWTGDVMNRRMDGSVFWTNLKVTSHELPSIGRVWIGVQRDVSFRKQAEFDLQQSTAQLELAMDISGSTMWDFHPPSGIVKRDARFAAMLGHDPNSQTYHRDAWQSLLHPDDIENALATVSAHINGDTEKYECEYRLRHADGHFIWVHSAGKAVERDKEGKAVRIVGMLKDISHSKRLVEEAGNIIRRFEALIKDYAHQLSAQSTSHRHMDEEAVESLSRRQRQVLILIAKGLSSAQIAEALHISTGTAIGHRRDLMRKLDLHTAADVTRFALRNRLIEG
jgi:PAS domain S-box-containing protein